MSNESQPATPTAQVVKQLVSLVIHSRTFEPGTASTYDANGKEVELERRKK